MARVIAGGYDVTVDAGMSSILARKGVAVPAGHANKMGVHFGSASFGAPITMSDAAIRAWYEGRPSDCSLRLAEVLVNGFVLGRFIDGNGYAFLGVIADLRDEKQRKRGGVMKAMEHLEGFERHSVEWCVVRARPYLWVKD